MKKQVIAILSIMVAVSAAYSQRSDYGHGRHNHSHDYEEDGYQQPTYSNRDSMVRPARSQSLQERQAILSATEVANMASELAQKISSSEASDAQLSQVNTQLNAVAKDLISLSKQLDSAAKPGTCVIYTEPNFQGLAIELRAGEAAGHFGQSIVNGRYENLNDKMSSLAVARGCTLQMWQDKYFGGQMDTYTMSTPQFSKEKDDFYTSAKCFCN